MESYKVSSRQELKDVLSEVRVQVAAAGIVFEADMPDRVIAHLETAKAIISSYTKLIERRAKHETV